MCKRRHLDCGAQRQSAVGESRFGVRFYGWNDLNQHIRPRRAVPVTDTGARLVLSGSCVAPRSVSVRVPTDEVALVGRDGVTTERRPKRPKHPSTV